MSTEPVRLTQFSHGAGCGCKLSPQVLHSILQGQAAAPNARLLVGNNDRDDAAVYELEGGDCVISTVDFFMPIVDDAFDFGRVAATNAISDVYAMGGRPFMALAVLGWPVGKIPPEIAGRVLAGARAVCGDAGVVLAGGHSIDSPEPIFGLSVNGTVKKENIKANSGGKKGDWLYLSKPLGIGILTTAEKRGLLKNEDRGAAVQWMTRLNDIGEKLGALRSVSAMTDITGFGLLGHLASLAEASGVSAEIEFAKIPKLPRIDAYLADKCFPGGTLRNLESYQARLDAAPELGEAAKLLVADPQTSGGLLVCVTEEGRDEVERLFGGAGLADFAVPIGRLTAGPPGRVKVC